MTDMEKTIRFNIHKDMVGGKMFCPLCRAVLDCRKAVSVDMHKGDAFLSATVLCLKCYQGIPRERLEGMPKEGQRMEVFNDKTKELETFTFKGV